MFQTTNQIVYASNLWPKIVYYNVQIQRVLNISWRVNSQAPQLVKVVNGPGYLVISTKMMYVLRCVKTLCEPVPFSHQDS